MPIDRRDFLRLSLASSLAAASTPLSALASVPTNLKRRGQPKRVLIIGAGLSGLVAGYELHQAGHQVTILEAQSRPGGRVLTLRTPFADGLYADVGATRIPNWHALTLRYAEQFGLSLLPFRPEDGPEDSPERNLVDLTFLRGQRIRMRREGPYSWAPDVPETQRGVTLAQAREQHIAPLIEQIRDPLGNNWLPAGFAQYDEMTEVEYLRRQGVSQAVIDLLNMGIPGRSLLYDLRTDAVEAMQRRRRQSPRNRYWKIAGGNDLLPRAFARQLSGQINYGSPVVRIEHTQNNVRATVRRPGGTEVFTADRLICTIPFSTLRRVEITPPFSFGKRRAIAELPYLSSTKIFVQTRTQYWLRDGLSGFARTDHPMQVWNVGHGLGSTRGILNTYMIHHLQNNFTLGIADMSEEQRVRFAATEIERVLPGMRDTYEAGVSKCWDQDEWAKGAAAFFWPGQTLNLMPFLASAEGRVHFGGDHTTLTSGWMQGALESGLRTANEVNGAA